MFYMLIANVFHAKSVYEKRESDGADVVLPQAWGVFAWTVTKFLQMRIESLVCYLFGLI